MAANFKIKTRKKKDQLHLSLKGDFDGSSAFALINTLESLNGDTRNVVVDTCGLSSLHPFGLGVFQKNFPIAKRPYDLTFTGKYRDSMAP